MLRDVHIKLVVGDCYIVCNMHVYDFKVTDIHCDLIKYNLFIVL